MNCWEFIKCPKKTYENCPAYPENGYDCWKVPFTRCTHGKYLASTILKKTINCQECDFYRKNAHKFFHCLDVTL